MWHGCTKSSLPSVLQRAESVREIDWYCAVFVSRRDD